MKFLIDTNIVLDVLLKRAPFCNAAFPVFQLADKELIKGCISASVITDLFFLLRKERKDRSAVYTIMDDLTDLFTIVPVFETTISSALALRWKDFEDAVQFMAAKENGIECIITRNADDYKTTEIPCMSADDFLTFFNDKTTNPMNKV